MIAPMRLRTIVRLLVIGATTVALAQNVSDSDRKFVKEALEGGNAEVHLGQLAQQKASEADVRQFGQKMVDDHTKLGGQMKDVAERIGVSPPSGTAVSDKALAAKLDMLSGSSFDKAYIQSMIKDHRKDLEAFRNEAQNGTNPQVRDAASHGAQVVAEHLQLAEQIARDHNIEVSSK